LSGDRNAISKRTYILSISCLIAGVILIIMATQSKYMPFHLTFIGTLNIIVSYGITVREKWALYLALFTSLVSLLFGLITLAAIVFLGVQYDFINILILLAIILYIALSSALLLHVIFQGISFYKSS